MRVLLFNFSFWRQISFDRRLVGDRGDVALISVDGTHFCINEPEPFNSLWYSHKFHGPGLAYELGVCIKTGDIVWWNGPFPAKHPDRNIFRSTLKNLLLPGEKVVGDLGYKGETKVLTELDANSKTHKRAMAKLRARHETLNRRLKQFRCLGDKYRHDRNKHILVFKAAAALTQISIDLGDIPFQVDTYKDPAIKN